jgi:hypothetical protein
MFLVDVLAAMGMRVDRPVAVAMAVPAELSVVQNLSSHSELLLVISSMA